ncbi:hypothetical protein HY485_02010 [Candidatus Woesearchaeota archaeon]|nr:hypothetical protein [Candidatus Woesearchaeota archaeon]
MFSKEVNCLEHEFVIVGIVLVFAVSALFVSFAFNDASGFAVQKLSVSRCELPFGFEAQFSSKNECIHSLPVICSENCFGGVSGCIDLGKHSCEQVGRVFVRAFA